MKIPKNQILNDFKSSQMSGRQRVSSGASRFDLGVAKVVTINYEEHTATLRVILGEDQEFQRVPVPITYPGAGARHFFGALPEPGDYCLIGHLSQESFGGTRTPVILGWIVPGVFAGHDWLTTSPFSPDEYSMDPKDSEFVAGAFERVRHKLRHMEPGNIVASSSQGADLVLDEDARLTNRGCNEIVIRDADDAIVLRSQQSFGVHAGVRLYTGLVQRDATFLPTQMFSDGTDWAGPRQVNPETEDPYTDVELIQFSSDLPADYLSPADVFSRLSEDGTFADIAQSGITFDPELDPYVFLEKGLYINDGGYAYDGKVESDAVYAGKAMSRVSVVNDPEGNPLNAILGTGDRARAFTEYRIEIAETSDSVLPVSEQTEGIDIDRLPESSQTGEDDRGPSNNTPFVEFVLGNVVGNDPYTISGRDPYGYPLSAKIFNPGGDASPELVNATRLPLGEACASLFKMTPQTLQGGPPTFWSVLKDGRVRAAISGPASEDYAVEAHVRSGARFSTDGVMRFDAAGGFEFNSSGGSSQGNWGLNLASNTGAVRVYGGGQTTDGDLSRQTAPGQGGAIDSPDLVLEGRSNVEMKAGRRVLVNAAKINERSSEHQIGVQSNFSVNSGDRISLSSKTYSLVSNGKATEAFQGPKDALPTNGAFRSTTFTGLGIGPVDDYLCVQGDRQEIFLLGSHRTTIVVGGITHETQLGFYQARAGLNLTTIDSVSGITTNITNGNLTENVVAGGVFMSSQTNMVMRTTGPAVVSGVASVTLGGPGKIGGIVVNSDLDPLSGLPLATYGMGSPGHFTGPSS